MAGISRKMYERNSIQTVVGNDGIFWLNEKVIEERLDHKNKKKIREKCHSDHGKYKSELVEEAKKQINRISIDEKLATKMIMDCRTTSAHKFRTRLAFKQKNNKC